MVGPPCAASGDRQCLAANVSVHFIITWFGKTEIPGASYLLPLLSCPPGAFV